jgi:hypothetical protein
MNQWKPLLTYHLEKYPKMENQDVLKLLYQACFGPSHMGESPTRQSLLHHLEIELEQATYHRNTLMVEPIGNHYHRLSIESVCRGLITHDELIDAFMKSSRRSLSWDMARHAFLSGLEDYKKILINDESARIALISYETTYLKSGIRALHHSDVYRSHYCPHYRVIHKNDVPIGVRHLMQDCF